MTRKKQQDLPFDLPRMPTGSAPSIARPRKRHSSYRRAPRRFSKEFFDLYLTEVPYGAEYHLDAAPVVVQMLGKPGYGFELSICVTLDSASLALVHPCFDEPKEIAFSDHAHWHPHVLRLVETEAICAATQMKPSAKSAPDIAKVLLSIFTVCTGADGEAKREGMKQALTHLGFSSDEIEALRERAFFPHVFGSIDGVSWQRRDDDWIICGDGIYYSFRTAESDSFPHRQFAEVMERFV